MLDKEVDKWYAVKVKFKTEKFVRDELAKKGIEVFVPILTQWKVYSSKRKKVEKPLISQYVFVRTNQSRYLDVLNTSYVFSFLKLAGNIIPIPDKEIEILHRVIGEYDDVKVHKANIQSGDFVEIISGQLTGLQGNVIRQANGSRMYVRLEHLGMDLEFQIEESHLQKLSAAR